MGKDDLNINGYNDDEDSNKEDYREQILQLCKLAQGNITTIYWCKQQIRKRLKVLDRLVKRLSDLEDDDTQKNRIESIIKKQTDACKELGDKIETEIESLEAIRVAAKSFGIDIKARLLELDDTLDSDDFDDFFAED